MFTRAIGIIGKNINGIDVVEVFMTEPTPPFKQVRPWPHHFLRLSVFFFLNVTGKDYGLRA